MRLRYRWIELLTSVGGHVRIAASLLTVVESVGAVGRWVLCKPVVDGRCLLSSQQLSK